MLLLTIFEERRNLLNRNEIQYMFAVVASNLDVYSPLQMEHHNERKLSINPEHFQATFYHFLVK